MNRDEHRNRNLKFHSVRCWPAPQDFEFVHLTFLFLAETTKNWTKINITNEKKKYVRGVQKPLLFIYLFFH